MSVKSLKRPIIMRMLGVPATGLPLEKDSWTYDGSTLVVNLEKTRELSRTGGAVRIEGRGLPDRLLIVNGEDGKFHAYSNRCRHMGRRFDPVPDTDTVQCCSIMRATYDYSGARIAGPASGKLKTYGIETYDGKLIIRL
ncbi:MAG TPA: Rieske (2Fe-2S) protein [Spirochaetota bacterium]|nr:Rieske (2Fe-2S) protein [Spirochaetota bacterium]HPR49955.1 Rieske (2Fe-2S) protein [Spirochaetota bacterium]